GDRGGRLARLAALAGRRSAAPLWLAVARQCAVGAGVLWSAPARSGAADDRRDAGSHRAHDPRLRAGQPARRLADGALSRLGLLRGLSRCRLLVAQPGLMAANLTRRQV